MIIKIFISSLICWTVIYFYAVAATIAADEIEWSNAEESKKEKAKKRAYRIKKFLGITLLPLVLLAVSSLLILIWG
jgi:hypothetical protein